MKGIRISVLKNSKNSSKAGISSQVDEFTLVGFGVPEMTKADAIAPEIRLEMSAMGFFYLVPSTLAEGYFVKAGSNFGWSDDWRLKGVAGWDGRPLPIYDVVG